MCIRDRTQKPQPPIKDQQQREEPRDGRHPAVVRHMDSVLIMRCGLNYFPQDAPDVPERYQRQQCTDGGQPPTKGRPGFCSSRCSPAAGIGWSVFSRISPSHQLEQTNYLAFDWGRDTDCSFPAPVLYDLFSSSRSVIFRRLMPSVDPLCSSAEVVGGSTPATPSAISVRLKPTMKR